MEYRDTTAAICFGDLKQAALYFDRVLPVDLRRIRGQGSERDILVDIPEEMPARALVELVFGVLSPNKQEGWRLLGSFIDRWDEFRKTLHSAAYGAHDDLPYLYRTDAVDHRGGHVRAAFRSFAETLGIPDSAVLLAEESTDVSEWDYHMLSLQKVPLIDTRAATWEQIVELRRDESARRRLRNLRLFLTDTYQSKSRAYVEDDLERRLDEYDATRKQLGLSSTIGTLSLVLDSKTLHSAAVVGLSAALLAGPLAALLSAGAVEVGRLALELAERRAAIKNYEQDHPLAYVVQAQRTLTAEARL
jgi:hypothetical protein